MRLFYDEFGLTGFGFALVVIAASVVVTGAIIAVGNGFAAASCDQVGEMTGRETAYRFPSGCFVKNEGQFIPVDEFQARAITNERGRQ